MILVKINSSELSSEVELVAENADGFECLVYSVEGDEFAGSVAGFEQRYKPGRLSFVDLEALKLDYQRYIDSDFPNAVINVCKDLTRHREALNNAEDSTVVMDGFTWQTDPQSLMKLNNAITAFGLLKALPSEMKWWDASNVPHVVDLDYLSRIAAAEAGRQYRNFALCQELKEIARGIEAVPGCYSKLRAVRWPVEK